MSKYIDLGKVYVLEGFLSSMSTLHRGRKGPFNTFSKNVFSKWVSMNQNYQRTQFYAWINKGGSKSLKKGQKMSKKATNLV